MSEPIILPLGDPDAKKAQVMLTVEPAVKELIENIATKGESSKLKLITEKFENYPEINRKTIIGVVLHYFIKGVKEDMNIEFDRPPHAVSETKTPSSSTGSRSGLSKAKKNDILARKDGNYYDEQLDSGEYTEDQVWNLIKEARAEQKYWEDLGWVLPKQKNLAPVQKDTPEYEIYLAKRAEAERIQSKNIEAAQKQRAENIAAAKS